MSTIESEPPYIKICTCKRFPPHTCFTLYLYSKATAHSLWWFDQSPSSKSTTLDAPPIQVLISQIVIKRLTAFLWLVVVGIAVYKQPHTPWSQRVLHTPRRIADDKYSPHSVQSDVSAESHAKNHSSHQYNKTILKSTKIVLFCVPAYFFVVVIYRARDSILAALCRFTNHPIPDISVDNHSGLAATHSKGYIFTNTHRCCRQILVKLCANLCDKTQNKVFTVKLKIHLLSQQKNK